ncbi:hypothetical protein pb186bvf_009684 [Paramecium bursaria]
MIQNIIQKLPLTDIWYLIECVVSMVEISYQKDQKNYQSISPKQKVLPYNFKPASPQRRLTPTLKITQKKDYSLEKLTLQKEKSKEFSLKSSKINIKKQLTPQNNQAKQQTTIQSNEIKFTLEKKPQTYVRNYYLSVLMQTTPPRYKPQRFLKLDISKLSQKETTEGSPQQRILQQEKTQKLFKSLQTMKSDSEDEATDPKQPIQFRQESQGYLLRLVDGKNDIIQQESFESSEESVYNQVVEEIMESYDIQQKEIVTNRKSTVLSLNQENIDKIKRASLEQQLPQFKQNEGPKLRRGALSQKFKEMHLKLQLILGGGPQEIVKHQDDDYSEQTDYIEQYYERGSLLPANRKPRTNEDQFLFNDL